MNQNVLLILFLLDDNLFTTNPVQKNNDADESIVVTYGRNCQNQHTIRHRAPNVLPTFENSADDLDNLDDVYLMFQFFFIIYNLPDLYALKTLEICTINLYSYFVEIYPLKQ